MAGDHRTSSSSSNTCRQRLSVTLSPNGVQDMRSDTALCRMRTLSMLSGWGQLDS